jgi:hypothetical protein
MKIKVAVDFRAGYWNPRNDKLQASGWRRWSEPVQLRPSPLGCSKQDDWDQEPAEGGEVVDERSLRRVWAAWGGRPVSSLRDLYVWHKASSRSFIPRPDLPVDPLEAGDSGDADQASSESEDEDSADPADQTGTIDVDEGESLIVDYAPQCWTSFEADAQYNLRKVNEIVPCFRFNGCPTLPGSTAG